MKSTEMSSAHPHDISGCSIHTLGQLHLSCGNHNFLCLAPHFTVQVPKADYKQLSIGLNAGPDKLQEKLLIGFPRLCDAGGYDLFRCLPNSRTLSMLQPPQGGFTPAHLKQEVGGARIYIQPIRRDLLLDDVVSQ